MNTSILLYIFSLPVLKSTYHIYAIKSSSN